MRRPIARIKINAGNPGWYDPLTNIHLTITRPEAIVYEGSNTINIKKGVAFKLVSVVDGNLDVNIAFINESKKAVETVREVAHQPITQEEVKAPPVEETKVEEETITEPVITEEVIEKTITETVEEEIKTIEEVVQENVEIVEEVIEEKPKKKTTKKTKAKK
ncbi:MAG: hypothetical protein RR406_00290 [Bacilli bacterium]